MRNLAQRSAEAARSTSDLIAGSVERAEDGVKTVSEVGNVFSTIQTSVADVVSVVGSLSDAVQEQVTRIAEINRGLAQIETVTQSNAANAEETASAAQELASHASALREVAGRLAWLGVGRAADLGDEAHGAHALPGGNGATQRAAAGNGGNGHQAEPRRLSLRERIADDEPGEPPAFGQLADRDFRDMS